MGTCVLWISAPFVLYASHVKSAATAGNRPAGKEKVGTLGEVDRGPRGKNQIALTFDAGAEAECFDDLITALANAHVSSTFFITGRFAYNPCGLRCGDRKTWSRSRKSHLESSQFDPTIG